MGCVNCEFVTVIIIPAVIPRMSYLMICQVADEYSCAITPQVRQAGNRLSGLTETAYASLLA